MSIYNEDELVPPSWINQEFLGKVLNEYEKTENLQINDFDLKPSSMKGDHYGSIMFRCKVSYGYDKSGECKKKSLIIKTLPMEECTKRDLLGNSGVFETEINMYTQTLPKIQQILADCGEPTKMSADIIYHSLEPHKVIILEDLCEYGFDTIRGRHLTEEEMKMIYKKIAKFHAVSHMLGKSEDHEVVTKYQKGLFSNSAIMSFDLFSLGIENFIDMLSEHEEFAEYLEKVKVMQPNMLKACMELYNAYKLNNGQGDIFVLNHGDFHMKNMMFKFNKKTQLEDIIMVDYQLSCYAPSHIDMFYSQFQMLSPDLRLRRHEFMLYYFGEFVRVLKKLNPEGEMPKYSDFQIAAIKYRNMNLFLLSTFLPMFGDLATLTADDLKDVDTTTTLEDVEMLRSSYKNPNYINDMRRFLPILLSEGYLD